MGNKKSKKTNNFKKDQQSKKQPVPFGLLFLSHSPIERHRPGSVLA